MLVTSINIVGSIEIEIIIIIIIYFICKAQFKYKTNSFHSFSLRGSVTNSHMIVNNISKLVKKLSEQVGL